MYFTWSVAHQGILPNFCGLAFRCTSCSISRVFLVQNAKMQTIGFDDNGIPVIMRMVRSQHAQTLNTITQQTLTTNETMKTTTGGDSMLQLFLYKPLRNKISSQTTCGACCTPSTQHAHQQQQHEHEQKQDEKQHLTSPVTLLCVFCSFSMSCFACYMCYAECTIGVDSIGSAANRSQNGITSHGYDYCYVSAAVVWMLLYCSIACWLIAWSIGSQLHHHPLYDCCVLSFAAC